MQYFSYKTIDILRNTCYNIDSKKHDTTGKPDSTNGETPSCERQAGNKETGGNHNDSNKEKLYSNKPG